MGRPRGSCRTGPHQRPWRPRAQGARLRKILISDHMFRDPPEIPDHRNHRRRDLGTPGRRKVGDLLWG